MVLKPKKNYGLAAVGFEPTPPKRLEPKSSALDRSATLPLLSEHGSLGNVVSRDIRPT